MISNMGSASSSQIPGRKSSSAVSKVSGLRWLAYGLARRLGLRHWRDRFVLNFPRSPLYKMIGFPYGRLPSAGDVFSGFFLIQRAMRELSIFIDESGSDGLFDRYCLLTVVMHDQSDSIADSTEVI